jgi:thioredoxin reductase
MKSEVAIVGAGPAGLSAAIEAAGAGAQVVLVDENDRAGGQLFKQIHKFFGSREHLAGSRGMDVGTRLLDAVNKTRTEVLLETIAWGFFEDRSIGIIRNGHNELLQTDALLLATGALENAITFPGWTLPGVMGAGAMQTFVNIHRVLPAKRILMIGAGNVGLIVAYQLRQAGADVVCIVEASPKIGGYGVHASKIRRNGVPILTSTTIKAAIGSEQVEGVVLHQIDEKWNPLPGTEKTFEVDGICLAAGLSPLDELARMAGCQFMYLPEIGGSIPVHDENMETSQPGIYVAGDLAGIEEASTAIEEGRLAGISIAERLGYIDMQTATEKKETIWARLHELRGGPFGVSRRSAKNQIMMERKGTWRY